MAREIKYCEMTLTPITVSLKGDEQIGDWLAANAPKSADTLLAFDLDGLVWGMMKDGKIVTASEHAVGLHKETLQEVRLFGESSELYLWRTEDGFQAHVITDLDGTNNEYIEESQILWGDKADPIEDSNFTLMSEGGQGLQHAVPLSLSGEYETRPLRLKLRHYLAAGEPFARIAFSRLVKLEVIHG